MQVFFTDGDYRHYRGVLAKSARRHQLETWAYCLMPNHVHLIVVPHTPESLARSIGESHRRYAVHVNRREGWRGHLWQERFASFPMDEAHLYSAVRYVLQNPVRAGLVQRAQDWPHSSAAAHLGRAKDPLVTLEPLASRLGDLEDYLSDAEEQVEVESLRRHSSTGRPLGSRPFVERLEGLIGRRLVKRNPGPTPRKR